MAETKTLICEKCGKEFQVGRNPNNPKQFIRRKYCPDCDLSKQKFKTIRCKNCGKEFQVGRTADGRHFINRTVCDDCLKPPETKTLICEKCGKEFQTIRSKISGDFLLRKYCSECDYSGKEFKLAKCVTCGKEFKQYRTPSGGFSESKYCSYSCGLLQEKTKICEVCGKEFKLKRSETTGYFLDNVKYCSDECAQRGWEHKTKQTCQEKYGVDYPCLTEQYLNSVGTRMHSKVNENFGKLLTKLNIDFEDDFKLGNYFYDFYIKDTNVFIEINPTFTHTSFDTGVYPPLDRNYHRNKTEYAKTQGYRCINIWDWDDWCKIVDLLKFNKTLYARKLQLKEITKQEANIFIQNNHLQDSCYGNTVNLGLFYENQLVQVMTFGKSRYNENYEYELLRLCTKTGYKITGGAEKLFKHFIDNHKPNSIISYCDLSKFNGDVYQRLKFNLLRINTPSKHWCNKERKHILNSLLMQQGFDRLFKTNYGKGTSNEELMLENGWLPIYDCGQAVYVWDSKSNM